MSKLTVKGVDGLIRAAKPGMFGDGNGLYLQISRTGGVSWIYRYRFVEKTRDMGLGKYPEVGLAQARSIADGQRKLKLSGVDPITQRNVQKENQRAAARAREATDTFFEKLAMDHQAVLGAHWTDRWRRGWIRQMELYAFPIIGKLPPALIQTDHLIEILKPIWSQKNRTANEVRSHIEQVLDGAKAKGLRNGDNPARWRGHLDNLLSRTERKKSAKGTHFSAMKWQDVPGLMAELREVEQYAARSAELMILTGARARMVRFASWSEFDLEKGVWALSAERMKMRHAFEIPLAPQVVSLIRTLDHVDNSPYLFPGIGRTGVIHANAIRNLLHALGHTDITRHGFRSSFRDWASEMTDHPWEICEMALSHVARSKTEAAYMRSSLVEKRRGLMNDWAKFATTFTLPS